jgi:hypothetical protein
MGFLDFVGSALSGAASFLSTLSGSLAGTANNLLKVAGPLLEKVGGAVQMVAVLLDVLKPDEKPEELGAKALVADKKPEDFDSNAGYINYLRNEVQLDKEKFDKASVTEKVIHMAIGTSLVSKSIEEKKGFNIPLTFWVKVAGQALKAKEINALIDTFKADNLDKFTAYSEGKLNYKDEIKTGDKLVKMYKELEPNLSNEEIEQKVMKLEVTK